MEGMYGCMSINEYNKSELLHYENLKKGQAKAFEYFFNKYHGRILGFCLQFVYDKPEAKGITQEAFLNLWLQRDKIEKLSGIESFLYTYAKSKCLNAVRHHKIKERFISKTLSKKERLLDYEILNAMDFDTLTLNELEQLITKSINELPEKTNAIFCKKRFENKKNHEIADELQISIKTVEHHMTKALSILRIKLSAYLTLLILATILFL